MQVNLFQSSNNERAVQKIQAKLDPELKKQPIPHFEMSAAQINRTYEISKDPPVTILKFENEKTKQVELQIPSELQLRIYRDMQKFVNDQQAIKAAATVDVRV